MRTEYLMLLLFVVNPIFGQIPLRAIAIEDAAFNNYFLNRDNIPRITGKIMNLAKEDINKIKIDYTIVTPFEQFQVKKSAALNTDGSFELKLDYAFPYQQIWISVDSLFYTGIYVNTDLFIEMDAAVLKSQNDLSFNSAGVKYLGRDGALNEYANDHVLFKRKEQLEISSQVQGILPQARKDYNAFIKKYDSLYLVLNELDNEFIKQKPPDFSWLLKNERQSNYFADLCAVFWGTQMPPELFEKVKAYKPYATSNDAMLFYRYLFTYLITETPKKQAAGNVPYTMAEATLRTISMLDSLFAPSKSDFLKIKFSSRDLQEQKRMIETVLPHVTTAWCKSVINDEYNKTVEKLLSINKILNESKPFVSGSQLGEPVAELPFGARLYKVNAIKADTLLSMIKSSFKNKALLIDIWATWCGPCIAEFPYSKKLNDDSKDLPIEFVYLCTSDGSDMEKWKSKIIEYKLSGTHIFVEKSIESAFMNLFSFSGYPSYLLINTRGEYKPGIVNRLSELNKDKLAELIK